MLPISPPHHLCEWYLKAFVSLQENAKMPVFIYSNKTSKVNPPYLAKINYYFHWSWTMIFHRLTCSSHRVSEAQALSSGKGRTQALSLLLFNDPCHFPQKQTRWTKLARIELKIPCLLLFESPVLTLHGCAELFCIIKQPKVHSTTRVLLTVKCCLCAHFAKHFGSFSKEGTIEI